MVRLEVLVNMLQWNSQKQGLTWLLFGAQKEDVAKGIAEQAEALGRKVSLHHCDVTEDGAAAKALAEAAETHGRVHTLVWGRDLLLIR